MLIKVLMPALSPSLETGKLTRWLVAAGDRVEPGDVIAEIETANATMEVEAVDGGVIGELLLAAGTEGIEVDTPIATIVTGDGAEVFRTGATSPEPEGAQELAGRRRRTKASPLARRLAAASGMDLVEIAGSGPMGRVVKRDVLARQASAERRAAHALKAAGSVELPGRESPGRAAVARDAPSRSPSRSLAMLAPPALRPAGRHRDTIADADILDLFDSGSYDLVAHDPMRREIAARLQQAQRDIPHLSLRIECRMEEIVRARIRMNGGLTLSGQRLELTITHFLVKALALALRQVPAANVTWTESAMLQHRASDVGVAVATGAGVVTPVIRAADTKPLAEISAELGDLAGRARQRRLDPRECGGGATAISNLGMLGVRDFDAIVRPPQASVLAVGAAEQRPVVVEGRLEVATVMSCSLACDERAIDGATGAALLAAFKTFVEDPLRMLV